MKNKLWKITSWLRAEDMMLTLILKNRIHTNKCIIMHAATVCKKEIEFAMLHFSSRRF